MQLLNFFKISESVCDLFLNLAKVAIRVSGEGRTIREKRNL